MKIAFLFPGQGSQYVGMGKAMHESSPLAKQLFEESDDVLGFSLKELCFNGDINDLSLTANAQPAILTVSYIAFRLFMERYGIGPKYLAGHSLGEYTALTCTDAISFADALKIVRERGRLMQEAMDGNSGKMLAVRGKNIDSAWIDEECKSLSTEQSLAVISNYNSPHEIVISGHADAVDQFGERLQRNGLDTIELKVSAPFHCPLMHAAARQFEQFLANYTFAMPKWPIISNVNALPYRLVDDLVDQLAAQMVSPVKWEASMAYIRNQDIQIVTEFGPKKILKKMMKDISPEIEAFAWDIEEDQSAFDQQMQSMTKALRLNFMTKCIAIAICTRNRNWNEEQYQKGFVEPYRAIKELEKSLRDADAEPTFEQMQDALRMLESTFTTKGTPTEEQRERYEELFYETGTRELFADQKLPVFA